METTCANTVAVAAAAASSCQLGTVSRVCVSVASYRSRRRQAERDETTRHAALSSSCFPPSRSHLLVSATAKQAIRPRQQPAGWQDDDNVQSGKDISRPALSQPYSGDGQDYTLVRMWKGSVVDARRCKLYSRLKNKYDTTRGGTLCRIAQLFTNEGCSVLGNSHQKRSGY